MGRELLSEVKDVLTSRACQTSLRELSDKGVQNVRVIRSSQIVELIREAVERAIAERGLDPDAGERQEIAEESHQIFRDMVQQMRSGEQERTAEHRRHMQRAEGELEALREQVAQRDTELERARAETAELQAELRVLHQRQEAGGSDNLLDELKALRGEIAKASRGGGMRGGGGDGVADDLPSDLSGLFDQSPSMESNLESLETEERKGADVSDALAKMKSLRKGKDKSGG